MHFLSRTPSGLRLAPWLLTACAAQAQAVPPEPLASGWLASLGSLLHLPASLSLGPLALPTGVLVLMLAWMLSQWLAGRADRRAGTRAEALLWQAAIAGLLVARLAYVAQWWPEYAQPPGTGAGLAAVAGRIADIRDGGWNAWAGLVAALAWALWRSRQGAALRRAMALPLAAGAAVVVLGQGLQALPAASTPGLPAFTLVNGQAQPVALQQMQQLEGQPMVVNLWASWCPPCRREMPVLAQAQQQRPDVRFIWINQGESAEAVMRYLQGQPTTPPLPTAQVLLDPQQQAGRHWRQRGLPSTYFYNAGGQLCGMRMGELSHASLAEHLRDCS